MPFDKGTSGNPEGRPIGSKNKATIQLRESITTFLEDNFEQVKQDFSSLSPRDRSKLYCELLQYGIPKMQAIQLQSEYERLSDDQLDKIIDELRKP